MSLLPKNDFKITKFQTFTNTSVQSLFGDLFPKNGNVILSSNFGTCNNRFLNKYVVNKFRYTFVKKV